MQNFIVLVLAMMASGAIGFYLARDRYLGRNDKQLHVLGSEIKRMRRRARDVEAQNMRLKTENDRAQKYRQMRQMR